jgi:hypothetical protein
VYDANGSLADICREKQIQEILISSGKVSRKALERVREVCRDGDIQLKRAEMRIEPLDFE